MSVSVKKIINEFDIHISKKLGQHFLIDESVVNKEIQYAHICKNDTVLEIGPGFGILTKKLVKLAKKVIAIEKDRKLVEYLNKVISADNLEIINADATEYNFPKFNKLVANLPFQISSYITFKILNLNYELAVLIYQKEFAERLVAKKGSRLAVNCYYSARAHILAEVSRTAYYPQPNVDTAIVLLKPRSKKAFVVKDENTFFKITDFLFSMRRKKIQTSIKEFLLRLNLSKGDVYKIVAQLPFAQNRVEDLLPEQIGLIADYIYNHTKYYKSL
jgi:16S rRNA (adenine1518-N6/adenine1519-N6)-dimethyltransferase